MLDLHDITPESLVEFNKTVGETGLILKPNELESVYSSIDYYEADSLKIASVVRSLIKNHPFKDGNKRTAVLFLFISSKLHNLKLSDDQRLFEVIVEIASSHYSVEQIESMLFE